MCALVWESSHYDTYTFIYSNSSNTYLVILLLETCTSPLYVLHYTIYLTLAIATPSSSFTVRSINMCLLDRKHLDFFYMLSAEVCMQIQIFA